MKTAEEIFKSKIGEFKSDYPVIYNSDGLKRFVLEAMEEYAAQFQLPDVTDDEIEEYFLKEEPRGYGCSWYKGMVEGAKAMRDGKIGNKLTNK